ncbi:hypothetical protein AB6D11_06420 [Vibrio splendidus]
MNSSQFKEANNWFWILDPTTDSDPCSIKDIEIHRVVLWQETEKGLIGLLSLPNDRSSLSKANQVLRKGLYKHANDLSNREQAALKYKNESLTITPPRSAYDLKHPSPNDELMGLILGIQSANITHDIAVQAIKAWIVKHILDDALDSIERRDPQLKIYETSESDLFFSKWALRIENGEILPPHTYPEKP